MFPKKPTDYPKDKTAEMKSTEEEMVKQALVDEFGVEATPDSMTMFRLFTGYVSDLLIGMKVLLIIDGYRLGVHDFSALREMAGMPSKVVGASLGLPVWNVIFQYEGFPVMYESGILNVPTFDCHLEIFSADKIVRVNYDTPYVKGLPVTMTIREKWDSEKGDGYQERIVRKTYEDPFTLEFLEFHRCATLKSVPKTSAIDYKEDMDIIKMIMQAGRT